MNALRWLLAVVAAAQLAGCATAVPPADPRDPLERSNRAIFAFNEKLDEVLVKPVAQGYRAVLPQPVRGGIDNVFGTVGDAWSAINLVLQAKPTAALQMMMRVGTNLVFGFGGLFDPASDLGLERQPEDFGQTLGRWGVGAGPYLVVPVLGPYTLRYAAVYPVDRAGSLPTWLDEPRDRNRGTLLQLVSTRARLLDTTRVIDSIALDKYTLVRDGYLARRRNLIYDGDPPEEAAPAATN